MARVRITLVLLKVFLGSPDGSPLVWVCLFPSIASDIPRLSFGKLPT